MFEHRKKVVKPRFYWSGTMLIISKKLRESSFTFALCFSGFTEGIVFLNNCYQRSDCFEQSRTAAFIVRA